MQLSDSRQVATPPGIAISLLGKRFVIKYTRYFLLGKKFVNPLGKKVCKGIQESVR